MEITLDRICCGSGIVVWLLLPSVILLGQAKKYVHHKTLATALTRFYHRGESCSCEGDNNLISNQNAWLVIKFV